MQGLVASSFVAFYCVFFFFLNGALAHNTMIWPVPRAGTSELVNGICMGEPVYISSGSVVGLQQGSKQWSGLQKFGAAYNYRPCGNSLASGYSTNMEWARSTGTYDPKFNMNFTSAYGLTSLTANSQITVQTRGFFHDGVMSVRLCYENCHNLANFEKYVLGYWFVEGVQAGSSGTSYDAILTGTVKLPNRNCDRCVLQWVHDAQDIRSYVACADVSISGAISSGPDPLSYYCNGHPYCNCALEATSMAYGVGGRCPQRTTAASVVSTTSKAFWCNNCATSGCATQCGGPYRSNNGGTTSATTLYSNLPQYIQCTPTTPCRCNQCGTGGGATKITGLPGTTVTTPTTSPTTAPTSSPTTCPTCNCGFARGGFGEQEFSEGNDQAVAVDAAAPESVSAATLEANSADASELSNINTNGSSTLAVSVSVVGVIAMLAVIMGVRAAASA